MIYLLISIIASVSVSVLLKIAKRRKMDIFQLVAFNYPVAILLSFVLLKPDFKHFEIENSWWLFGSLGILLPLIFILMGKAIQVVGIVKADASQRLSLLITLLVAFFVWDEPAGWTKITAVALALLALILILYKGSQSPNKSGGGIYFLLAVWIGYGVIDLLFKLISKNTGNTFNTTLTLSFVTAGLVIFTILLIRKTRFNLQSLLGGIILGILNFANIFTYLTAHKHFSDSPSVVFTGMNTGVIALGTIIGLLVFNEKLNRINIAGILLALSAITLLFWQF